MVSNARVSLLLLAAVCMPIVLSGCERDNGIDCPTDLTDCDGECVNLLTNNRFCSATGACGTGCAAGEMCNGAGVCALFCWSGLTECGGECVNLLTDNRFCSATGDCGTGCAAGEVCDGAGVCAMSCQPGLTDCDGQCVDTDYDPANCGGCDDGAGSNTCAAGFQTCVNGQCQTLSYLLPTLATDVSVPADSVLVHGNTAYIIAGTVFKVLDVSDPLNPSLLGTVTHGFTDTRVEAHAFQDNIVWCVRSSSGGTGHATYVFGVDVSDPANPVVRGSLTLKTTTSLLSNKSVLYAGYWLVHDYSDNLIYVIDISNPDTPVKHSEWGVPNMVNGGPGTMMIDENLLYLTCGENFTLRIYNLTDLTTVTQVGFVSTAPEQQFGNPVKIGSYVYVGTNIYLGASFLKVIDVSDPANPTVVGSLPPAGALRGRNGKLFSFLGPTVSAFSLADPENPVVEASSTVPPPAPSTSLDIGRMSEPAAKWVGSYLVGMTHGSDAANNGVRALYFPVN